MHSSSLKPFAFQKSSQTALKRSKLHLKQKKTHPISKSHANISTSTPSTSITSKNPPHHQSKRKYTDKSILPVGYEHPYPLSPEQTKMLPQNISSYQQLRDFRITLPQNYNMGIDISDKHVALGNGSDTAIIYVNQESGKNHKVDFNFISTQSNRLANVLTHIGPEDAAAYQIHLANSEVGNKMIKNSLATNSSQTSSTMNPFPNFTGAVEGDWFGVHKGDRVSILMSQSVEVGLIHAAVYKTGAIALPLSVLFGPEALEYRINASGSKVLFTESGKISEVIEILHKIPTVQTIIVSPHLSSLGSQESLITPEERTLLKDLVGMAKKLGKNVKLMDEVLSQASSQYTTKMTSVHDPALLIATSGTTGMPKLALHRQSVLLGHLPGIEFFYDFFPRHDPVTKKPTDVIFTGSDVSWVGGLLNTLLVSMHHGVPVLASRAKKFDANYMFKLFQDYNITTAFLPPTALKMMKEVPNPSEKWNYIKNIKAIGSGGECLGESVLDWGKSAFNVEINEFYGQTECNLVIGNNSKILKVKPGSMGVSIPGHVVETVDNQGNILPVGQVGEIAVQAPHPIMMTGYFNNDKATKEKFITSPPNQHGEQKTWLLTGDLGKKDDEGYFYYIGRNDDVISSAGYRIGPAEVEMSLHHHPMVANSAVIGVPDELRQEVVKAFVVLTQQAQIELFGSESAFRDYLLANPHGNYPENSPLAQKSKEMTEFVKNKLAKHEFPRQIEFVPSLPMTTTGKVIRKQLKKAEFERYYKAMGKTIPEGMF